jgi:hypothetical protein
LYRGITEFSKLRHGYVIGRMKEQRIVLSENRDVDTCITDKCCAIQYEADSVTTEIALD